jgi:hypothetical protein
LDVRQGSEQGSGAGGRSDGLRVHDSGLLADGRDLFGCHSGFQCKRPEPHGRVSDVGFRKHRLEFHVQAR